MNYSKILAETVYRKVSKKVLNSEKIVVIGIDGPTAVGKTILADNLKAYLLHDGYDVWAYRLDWTLVDRAIRVSDLANIVKIDNLFKHEAEMHMELNKAVEFLQNISLYNDSLEAGCSSNKLLSIEKLYSREDGGRNTGKAECTLKKGLVVIIEGHYTLRDELNDLVDFNILLLADCNELLDRKINRVSGYRGREQAEDYFWRVDLPSIRHHLVRYSRNANLIINNTSINNPVVVLHDYINEWVAINDNSSDYVEPDQLSDNNISQAILSVSNIVDISSKNILTDSIATILKWDRTIGELIRLSMDDISLDLYGVTSSFISSLHEKYNDDFSVVVTYTNALHNVYYRRLPVSFGFTFKSNNKAGRYFDIAVDSFDKIIRIIFSWNGGAQIFTIDRELGEIDPDQDGNTVYKKYQIDAIVNDKFIFWLPTSYTKPEFIKNIDNIEYVYTGIEDSNISSTEILCQMLSLSNCIWVHRFPKHASVHLFQRILNQFNILTCKAGNYLICFKSLDAGFIDAFVDFKKTWSQSYAELLLSHQDEEAYDSQVENERKALAEFVIHKCKNFKILDTYLFTSSTPFDVDWPSVVEQIKLMLSSNNRLLRKRTIEFIEYMIPDFMLDSNKIWPHLKYGKKREVSIQEIIESYPSIMGEVFLWTELRGDDAAILGANIYDIREQSIDAYAHLLSSIDKQTGVILQASLNAIGQKESESEGYLKLEHTPQQYIDSVLNTVRQMLLDEVAGKPFYGIGIDHLNKSGDYPLGRAKRFFDKCLSTECVTYFVLDGDILFGATDRSYDELKISYRKIADYISSLLIGEYSTYIFDKEISISELNYIGKETWVPSSKEVKWFVEEFQQCLREKGLAANNARPTLFIGNIGTTHHSKDLSNNIDSSISKKWVNSAKKYNFISAVLHGTTNSNRSLLRNANNGCHKINVAGDFLNHFVKLLPNNISQSIHNEYSEFKKVMYKYRSDLDQLTNENQDSIKLQFSKYVAQLMSDIDSPVLDDLDQEYFRYSFYKLSSTEINEIISKLAKWKQGLISNDQTKRSYTYILYEFSPSMIEVPYDGQFDDLVEGMKNNGTKYFHIDVGDGEYISRVFSGLDKIDSIKKINNDFVVHVHLMVCNPHLNNNEKISIIEEYSSIGADRIGVHRKSFTDHHGMECAILMIRSYGVEPGFVLETTEQINQELFEDLVSFDIEWVTVMGVPIGFGGQLFDMETLNKISSLHSWALHHNRNLLIEIDGGLTKNNILLCKNVGAQVFAGWSIVKSNTPSSIYNNIQTIQDSLK